METFLDGGLFELAIALIFAMLLNYIFLKKYLLIIFSVLIICCPLILFFINKTEWYYLLVACCLFNSGVLVALLWKEKKKHPEEILFNVEDMKNKLSAMRRKINVFFQKTFN